MRTEYQNLMYVLHHLVQVVYVAQYSAPTSARTPLPSAPPPYPPYCERQPPLSGSLEGYGVDRMATVRSSCGIGSVYTVEDVELQFTAVMTDAVPSLLQYSLDDSCSTPCSPVLGARTPGTYVRSLYAYLHSTYVTTTYVGSTTVHSTAWYRAKKKIIYHAVCACT